MNGFYRESSIREKFPKVLDILLLDRTRSTARASQNIIWANSNYRSKGKEYAQTSQIRSSLITGKRDNVIRSRAFKSKDIQKVRTKQKAEVFTPTWVLERQIDEVSADHRRSDLDSYLKIKWLEVACGEAPYITTRYDMETGDFIEVPERVGILDRKLTVINETLSEFLDWQKATELAYKTVYGFEWNGDSLLLARENLLYTYIENYVSKWQIYPDEKLLEKIAVIISYNIFQMDGLKYIIPLSEKKERVYSEQLSLFNVPEPKRWIIRKGIRVKVMDWEKNKMEFFDKGIGE